jgi:hypothetical protein
MIQQTLLLYHTQACHSESRYEFPGQFGFSPTDVKGVIPPTLVLLVHTDLVSLAR